MNFLDIRTVLFSDILSAAICAVVMWSLWLQYHQDSPELGFWLADYVMQFVGIMLIALRGTIPDLLSILPGTPLLLAGTLLLYIGLEHYVNRKTSHRVNITLLAFIIIIHIYFSVVTPSMQFRNIIFSVGLVVYCSQIAWLMLKRVDAKEQRTTRVVGIFFVVFSLVSLLRIVADLVIPSTNDLFKSGFYDTLVILIYQMLFIILTFVIILMVNRRLFFALEQDISQRKQTEIVLKEISMHDALTGLYNYGYFNEEMTRLENGREFPVSIMMIDVDDLKVTNDKLGHSHGDDLLVDLAAVLKAAFRKEDVVAHRRR